MKSRCIPHVLAAAVFVMAISPVQAGGRSEPGSSEQVKLPENQGYTTVQKILHAQCFGCHGWASSHEKIMRFVAAGHPDTSRLFQVIASDMMPTQGRKLTVDEKALIYAWIADGATTSTAPLTTQLPKGWLTRAASGQEDGETD